MVLSRRTTHLVKPSVRAPFLVSDHVYIGGLPSISSDTDVFQLIVSALGKPPNKIILRQNFSGSTKHAFVWMSSEYDATLCIQALYGHTHGNRKLTVTIHDNEGTLLLLIKHVQVGYATNSTERAQREVSSLQSKVLVKGIVENEQKLPKNASTGTPFSSPPGTPPQNGAIVTLGKIHRRVKCPFISPPETTSP